MSHVGLDRFPKEFSGLIVWESGGREGWRYGPVDPGTLPVALPDSTVILTTGFRCRDRGADGSDLARVARPISQLIGFGQLRPSGAPVLTLNRGPRLNPRIKLRVRLQGDPGAVRDRNLVLSREGQEIARLPLVGGKSLWTFEEIAPVLPREYGDGLPSGDYKLEISNLSDESFTIVPASVRAAVAARLEAARSVLRDPWLVPAHGRPLGPADLISLQLAAELLLGQTAPSGEPAPFLVDTLDLLEGVDPGQLTAHLRRVREHVLWKLDPRAGRPPEEPDPSPTGLKPIDEIRSRIRGGDWRDALHRIHAIEASSEPEGSRVRWLAGLYRATIEAEEGPARTDDVTKEFERTVRGLSGAPPDRFRAHFDYASFLLRTAQDRLYNAVFQSAAGGRNPISETWSAWAAAEGQLEMALGAAGSIDERAAALTDRARLYALAADVVRTIGPGLGGPNRSGDLVTAAARAARRLAEEGLAEAGKGAPDLMTKAVAEEVLAHLEFRERAAGPCRQHASAALAGYLDAGVLAGAESVYRLLGLLELEHAPKAALQNFRVSQLISEFLRSRFPGDRIGVGRGGFFARRAYVSGQITELLLDAGEVEEALQTAETAKARALEELLAASDARPLRVPPASLPVPAPPARTISEALASWPAETVGLEYYLGQERAWVFLVRWRAKVLAFPLLDQVGHPVHSAELLQRTRGALSDIRSYPDDIPAQVIHHRHFDRRWQDDLHWLYRVLIPPPVADKLRQAKHVVVAPQHILHYFPFAALVTEPDRTPRKPYDTPQPRFLVDEDFTLGYAPSLLVYDRLRRRDPRPMTNATALAIVDLNGPGKPAYAPDDVWIPTLDSVVAERAAFLTTFQEKDARVLPEGAATEANAKSWLGKPGLLLLAATECTTSSGRSTAPCSSTRAGRITAS